MTAYTNYSLRILMYCALHPGELVRIQDIAVSFGISRAHLLKSATHLGQLGYLTTVRGRSGGVTLALAPERISLGAVVREVEGTCEFVECFNSETNTCPIAGVCKLTALFHQAIEAFYQELDDVTLADLVRDGDQMRGRLAVLHLA